jgi:Rrf2 family protein
VSILDLIRRDTDYAFRIAAQLAKAYGGDEAVSARVLAKDNQVPAALTSKILQKLASAGLVSSTMGPKGGFRLAKKPEKIPFSQLITAVQGPVSVNRCVLGGFQCPLKKNCPAHPKMVDLQNQINGYLNELTLQEFVSKDSNDG